MKKLLKSGRFINPSVIITVADVDTVPKVGHSRLKHSLAEDNENVERKLENSAISRKAIAEQ